MNYILGLFIFLMVGVIFITVVPKQFDQPAACHTFAPTDTSHIRMNTCTGEAHIIVRGDEGFEWQRVNDRP